MGPAGFDSHAAHRLRLFRTGSEPKRIPMLRQFLAAAIVLIAAPLMTFAQTDEIQVYDAAIAEPGKFNLMLHTNFTPTAEEPGVPRRDHRRSIVQRRSRMGVRLDAIGSKEGFTCRCTASPMIAGTINGFKLRALFVGPHADDHTFVYGVNFEFSVNAKYWDPRRITSEIRPIIGWHLHPIDIIVNPILDTSYDGFKNLDFAPCRRVAYNFSKQWAGAVEEYADYGPLHQFLPAGEQSHQLYAVVDHTSKRFDLEAGVGFGLNGASDKVTLKLMVSRISTN